jgi:hypothetical protein
MSYDPNYQSQSWHSGCGTFIGLSVVFGSMAAGALWLIIEGVKWLFGL